MSGFEAFLIVMLFSSVIFIFVHAVRNAPPSSEPEPEPQPQVKKRRPKAKPKKRDDSEDVPGTIKIFRAPGGAFVAKVVPDKLTVHISKTTVTPAGGPVDCWVYASDGFWEVGQREIVFVLARREGEADGDFPRDILGAYRLFFHFACAGRIVDIGDLTWFEPTAPSLFGRDDFDGVVYAPPQFMAGVRLKKPWMLGIVATAKEIEVARKLGVVRFLTAIGKHYRFCPTAPWVDRDRKDLCSMESMADSFLGMVPSVGLRHASVRVLSRVGPIQEKPGPMGLVDKTLQHEKSVVVLRLRKAAVEVSEELEKLGPDTPFAFRVGPDPGLEACMSWEPGQTTPGAIAMCHATGASVSGNFIMFSPSTTDTDEGGITIEDGCCIFLSMESFQKVREALMSGTDLTIRTNEADKHDLAISWGPDLYPDFVHPEESRVMGGWAAFHLAGNTQSEGRIMAQSISLLTFELVMHLRIETEPLAEYIKSIVKVIEVHFVGADDDWPSGEMFVECTVRPDETRSFNIDCRPDEPPVRAIEALLEHLNEIVPPEVLFGPVSFQINLRTKRDEQRTIH